MGSPLGPTLANFFLGHLEKERIFNEPKEELYPRLYLRYVDDVFAVFSAGMDPMLFLTFLNNLHSSLKFTVEVGLDRMPFLDTEVQSRMAISRPGCIGRKPTLTSCLMLSLSVLANGSVGWSTALYIEPGPSAPVVSSFNKKWRS